MRLSISKGDAMQLEMGHLLAGVGAALLKRGAMAQSPGAAPELLQSALVDGMVMRWEEHGTRRDGSARGACAGMLRALEGCAASAR